MRITEALIKRTSSKKDLDSMFNELSCKAWNTFNSCRDRQNIWNRSDFMSIERRMGILAEKLDKDDYEFGNFIC